jgi:hypothetical protein
MISGYGDLEVILIFDYDSSIYQLRSVECMISYNKNYMCEMGSMNEGPKITTFHLVFCGNHTRHVFISLLVEVILIWFKEPLIPPRTSIPDELIVSLGVKVNLGSRYCRE